MNWAGIKGVCGSPRAALGVRVPVSTGVRTWKVRCGTTGVLADSVPMAWQQEPGCGLRGSYAWRLGPRGQLLGGPAAGGVHVVQLYICSCRWTSILLCQIGEQDGHLLLPVFV